MRVKRALVLGAFLGFLSLTVLFGILATSSDPSGQAPTSQQGAAQDPTDLNRDPGIVSSVDGEASGVDASVWWAGAVLGTAGTLGSFVGLRTEVRKEKDILRARKSRTQFYKDMRVYREQMKGPPRHNT